MKTLSNFSIVGATVVLAFSMAAATASAQGPVRNLIKKVQEKRQSSRIFEPQYEGGYPTVETAKAAFDEYDYQAATQFYIWGYAYLNSLGFEKGLVRLGGDERTIYLFDKRIQPQQGLITPNDEVVYVITPYIDLSKGPIVYEVPPRARGHLWDLGMRAYTDFGDIGPDKGKGGRYLIYSTDFKGKLPEGYHRVPIEHSNLVSPAIRTFPATEGSLEAAVKHGSTARWYYLSETDNPPQNPIFLIGDRPYSQEWPRDVKAFEWLAEAFNRDKVPDAGLAHMGNMRRLGIEKGKPFSPDERAKKILARAAKTAEAIVLSMAFRPRSEPIYENRKYEQVFNNVSPIFLLENYEEVEARAGGWHQLVGNFVTRVPAKPGTGQFNMATYRDAEGNFLIGSNTYRLRVPAMVPVKQFWQIPVYEVATRALINTDQKRTSLSSTQELAKNDDGSVDLYFAPKLPKGVAMSNWIKTKPGEGWFTLPRLYGPLQPILDKTWRWNDFEKVK